MSDDNINLQLPKIKSEFKVISLDLLDDPANPMRSDLSPESVRDLVASIKQLGIIEPLVVKPVDGRYEVVAGHRRLVAATIAELAEVPCYVVEASEEVSEMLKIHENIFRRDINPADEAGFYDWLIHHYKITPNKVAGMINKSPKYVMDRLQILEYPGELREALSEGKIQFTVAREFNRVTDIATMQRFLHYALRSGIVSSLARQWVDDWKRNSSPLAPTAQSAENEQSDGNEYITYVNCVYCKQQMEFFEATTIYIHNSCLNEVNKPTD